MSETLIISIIICYFLVLLIVSNLTKGSGNNKTFFTGDKQSPWYVVAFGMVGASIPSLRFQLML